MQTHWGRMVLASIRQLNAPEWAVIWGEGKA